MHTKLNGIERFIRVQIQYILGFSFFILINPLNAQLFSDHNYKFKTFSVKDGLAHEKVNKVLQDSKGFLWIATEGGLSRFDGYNFKNFIHIPSDSFSLPADNILDLCLDANDNVWLAFGHNMCKFDPINYSFKTFTFNGKPIKAQTLKFNSLDNHIYIASYENGVYKINTKNNLVFQTSLSKTLHHNVTSSLIDSKGIFWLTIERNGYYKYNIKQDTYEYLEYYDWPMFISEGDKSNEYYTGSWLGEFMIFDGKKLPEYNNRHALPKKFEGYEKVTFTSCAKAPKITGDEIIWVLSSQGIGLFDLKINKFIKHIDYQPQNYDGLSNNWLTHIFVDRDGQLWISSWHGLINVNPVAQSFVKFYLKELDINLYNLISGLVDDPHDRNKVWMSVNGSGIAQYDRSSSTIKKWYFKEFLYPNDFNYDRRWCHNIKRDSNDVFWVGSYGGFAKIKNGNVSFVNTWVNGAPIYGNDVFQDHEGMLWLHGSKLQKFNPYTETYESYDISDSLKKQYSGFDFITMAKNEKNKVYAGTTHGLFFFDETTKVFQKIDLIINNKKIQDNIRSLVKINDKLYIGTYSGLYIYDTRVKNLEQLLSTFIELKGITKDKFNNLWVYSTHGLYRINPITNKIDKFDQNDGVYNLSSDPCTFFEYNNEMFIGNRSVFTKFHPDKININNSIPIPYITEVVSGKQSKTTTSLKRNLILRHDESDITFHFTAIEYNYPSKLQFSYLLEGYDQSWSIFSNQRSKSYTGLEYGNYTFKIKARNNLDLESKTIATYTFTVKPAFWQTLWFKILSVLSLFGLIFHIARYRIAQIRTREKEKTEANKVIAELDAKLLRSQMNPHFIFNSLNSIQKYIWENNEEDAAEYLSKFAKLIRSILENSSKEFVTLEEEFKFLKIYLELEHKRSNGHFDYFFNIESNIDQSRILTPPMLLQPFIENAIWHGLNKKASHGNLHITVQRNEDVLSFIVEDDGVGRSPVVAEKEIKENKSMGISITKQRIEKLFESTVLKGKIEILDKKKKGERDGTKVIISLPLKYISNA